MKRFLQSGMLLLAMGGAAFAYQNDFVVSVPPMDPALVQVDDPVFINNGSFSVATPFIFLGGTANLLYSTSSTLDYTNNGTITAEPGFDFETFPAKVGKAQMANSWVNNGNGFGGGVITLNNIFGGGNVFQAGGVDGGTFPVNADIVGLAMIKVRATNVVNTGLITMDNTGLIDIVGKSVDMRHGQTVMTGVPTVNPGDGGDGGFGTNTVPFWRPATQLTPNSASSPFFTNFNNIVEQFSVVGSTAYFESTSPPLDVNNTRIWRIIFFLDTSPPNVSSQVFFGNSAFGNGAFHIQWTGTFRDLRTDQVSTNYFLFSDVPEVRRAPGGLTPIAGIPPEFSFNSGPTSFLTGAPATPSFVPDPFPGAVTNDFGFTGSTPQPLSLATNQVIGGSVTNLPGRIQLTSLDSMALDDTTAAGMNYMQLNAPNFLGNSNSYIAAPYADLNLGATNGSLVVSNLLAPFVPDWTASGGGLGGITAYSGSYFFVETNTPPGSTNAITITNDVRILIVAGSVQPTTPAYQKDVILHAANNLEIHDALTIYDNFASDTAKLTVATNDPSAYSKNGTLVIQPQSYNWSANLPNLQYLTNWGVISTANQGNFAGNMPSFLSPRSQATAYKAFVNYGNIQNQGIFVDADYFANSGSILENVVFGGFFGGVAGSAGIDIRATLAISTNSVLQATNGPISIAANMLLLSNSVVYSGRTLTFSNSCFLSDGYAFGNQFGHTTNATPANVVTNGNFITTAGGVQLLAQPATGDLLGTTITNLALNNLLSMNVWAGADRGRSPAGFAENAAVGRMVFNSDLQPSHFSFQGLNNNNALYVDSIELLGNTTNTDNNGNFTSFTIQPGMKIYFAQAIMNGVSIAEKLNGKNGGGFLWVSNYAGVYSSTNLNGTLYNQALVISPDIDSDGDGTVNRDDATPIPAGLTFDVANPGPIACGGGGTNPTNSVDNNPTNSSPQQTPGMLAFPAQDAGSAGVSFKLAQGSYSGLFYETNGVKPSSAGFFSAKLTGKGTFSAKLQLGSATYSFSKSFDASGNFTGTLTGKNLASLKVTLHLVNNDQITGQVSDMGVTWTSQLLALSEAKNASTFGLGKHSLVLSVNASNSTATASGDSYGTMTLSKNGDISWTGALPDGGKVSQKSTLSKDGVWPLYSSLYGGNGSLIGWLQVTNGTSDIGGSAVWVAPAGQNGLYQNGLTNELNATGSDVTSSAGTSQKTLILSGPQLSAPLTNSVTISGKTGQSANNKLTLSVDVKNGLFNGSVLDPNSGQTLSFQGALVERSGMGGGFFLNATKDQGGKVSLAPAN